MEFIISANTDIGIKKSTNQDSLTVKHLDTPAGKMVFAALCDGMGGLAKGELASATAVNAFSDWATRELPAFCAAAMDADMLKASWEGLANDLNNKIMDYGRRNGVNLGTTLLLLLLTQQSYYIMNVGDSRAYEITDELAQLTEDQTFVAREVKLGNMTPEQARTDANRNVLLQCVGASVTVVPDFFTGPTRPNSAYMLCSDGFRHEISPDEILGYLHPSVLPGKPEMDRNTKYLIDLNKNRMETDNISVVLIRTL